MCSLSSSSSSSSSSIKQQSLVKRRTNKHHSMMALLVLVLLGVLSLVVPCALAFTSNIPFPVASKYKYDNNHNMKLMMARTPEISDWRILSNGAVYGIVKYHPSIEDEDTITTSPLANPDASSENSLVMTKTGSKYKLLNQQNKQRTKPAIKNNNNKALIPKEISKAMAFKDLNLSGKTVGGDRYLLAGRPLRSTSGKSQIWDAYRADSDGNPVTTGMKLKVKVTPNKVALTREDGNYQRVTQGMFTGKFVSKIEFLLDANAKGISSQSSALVLESGVKDLKALLVKREGRGLSSRAMRDAASAAGQCIQAMHSSSMVWTDLKVENFVLTVDSDGEDGLEGVKGIDLESAMPFGGNPVDYSPEACPPEFATAFIKGDAPDFVLDPSYDMWSVGMMLYELSTGRAYFEGKTPVTITKTLASGFNADVKKVDNALLRDLIQQCLNSDPKKRPNITQYLFHPFFLTTGFGPISF